MNEMYAVITIGIGVQTIVNVVWLVMLNTINKRIERIENNIFNLK
jgi:hypothetical protein